MEGSEPSEMAPGLRQYRSQIDSPLPSFLAAPSIWTQEVAAPNRNSGGNASTVRGGASASLRLAPGSGWQDKPSTRTPAAEEAAVRRTLRRNLRRLITGKSSR